MCGPQHLNSNWPVSVQAVTCPVVVTCRAQAVMMKQCYWEEGWGLGTRTARPTGFTFLNCVPVAPVVAPPGWRTEGTRNKRNAALITNKKMLMTLVNTKTMNQFFLWETNWPLSLSPSSSLLTCETVRMIYAGKIVRIFIVLRITAVLKAAASLRVRLICRERSAASTLRW